MAKASALLDAIASLEDPQVGLRLLRSCAGHTRMVHSLRCNPPEPQLAALQAFDHKVRSSFSMLTGIHLSKPQWEQAGRAFGQAGLGLRSTTHDAPACYLASVGFTSERCCQLDAAYNSFPPRVQPAVTTALQAFNQAAAAPLTVDVALTKNQKALTMLLDTATWDRQLQTATVVSQAVLRSEAEPGARAFLAAPPSGKTRMEPAVFVTELRQRLGVADASTEAWCPRCDGVLDTLTLHAAVCCAGGERTVRHHALRDILATWVDRAGLQPEKKKGGLLLPPTIPAASGGGRQTCTSLHTLVHLLPLTWPSRPPRGRQPWEKLRAPVWRPLLPMRKPKQPIWKLLQHVGGKGLNFPP